MRGMLYGVGVGPGDPELLTLKAVRLIKASDIIAIPGKRREDTAAYRIAAQAVPEIADKECLALDMPMTKDAEKLENCHAKAAKRIAAVLETGKNAVFLTLGDPTVYSTYLYIHRRILQMGGKAELVSGVPSFCAAAAKMNIGLAEREEPLHIIPASYQIDGALELPGTKVLMKAGKKMKDVRERLLREQSAAFLIENCGMPGERCCVTAEDIPDDAGYYSLIIVKEKG